MAADIDIRDLRNCYGKFATGITVITSLGPDEIKIGLTVNSFSSLSLDPPMILWSLDNRSNNLDALKNASHFAVNVLASDQMEISNVFAGRSEDKFEGIELVESKCGLPLLGGTVAHLECKNVKQHEGGDHTIFIGEVEYFDITDRKPLLYANGQYAVAARHPQNKLPEPADDGRSASDDFIVPLLLKSYWELSDPFYQELLDAGVPVSHARILVHLSHTPKLNARELSDAIRVDMASVSMSVKWLCDKGHLERQKNETFILSDQGLSHLNAVQRRAERFESEVLDGYSDQEINMLKTVLKKLINRKDV